jgi:DNA-binding beta-propeller fold protein YncE
VVGKRRFSTEGAKDTSRRASRHGHARKATAFSLALLALLVAAGTAFAVTGQLTQLPGPAGCISETGSSAPGGPTDVCTDGKGLNYAASLAISRDGKNVYVIGQQNNAVAVFARNGTTGALTQLPGTAGCISENGTGGACARGKGLRGAFGVVVSGDGKHVYVSSAIDDAVAAFQRNATTGALTQLPGNAGCINRTGSTISGPTCADGRALDKPRFLAISGDGKNVYVTAGDEDAVAVFARNSTTGQLTQLAGSAGCVSETVTLEGCADGKALDNPFHATVSPDLKTVYVTSLVSNSVSVFRRNLTTGALTQLSGTSGCVSETGSAGACADGNVLRKPFSVAVSRDGENAYIASVQSDGVAVFDRDTITGKLTQLPGTDGCITETGSGGACADGRAVTDAITLTVSPDDLNVYVGGGYKTFSLVTLARDTVSGRLTQLPGTAGCFVQEGGIGEGCAPAEALQGAYYVVVSPGGKNVYMVADQSDAISLFTRETPP